VKRARKQPGRQKPRVTAPPGDNADSIDAAGIDEASLDAASAVSVSNLSLHELFAQQARDMLDRADIDEEQKQGILAAIACPCCGAGGMSFSVKLKPRE
jgi:hypothetical protein